MEEFQMEKLTIEIDRAAWDEFRKSAVAAPAPERVHGLDVNGTSPDNLYDALGVTPKKRPKKSKKLKGAPASLSSGGTSPDNLYAGKGEAPTPAPSGGQSVTSAPAQVSAHHGTAPKDAHHMAKSALADMAVRFSLGHLGR